VLLVVGFVIRIYRDAWSSECQIRKYILTTFSINYNLFILWSSGS